jgi:hypothetical protein
MPNASRFERRLLQASCLRGSASRRAITLLELVVAGSMLAVIATSLNLVLRTSRTAWETSDTEVAAKHHAQSVLLHFVRSAREAYKVVAMTASSITLETRTGAQISWQHMPVGPNGRSGTVMVRDSASGMQSPLAYDIHSLAFKAFKADGATLAATVDEIRLVQIDASVVVPGTTHPIQNYSSRVWIRAW